MIKNIKFLVIYTGGGLFYKKKSFIFKKKKFLKTDRANVFF